MRREKEMKQKKRKNRRTVQMERMAGDIFSLWRFNPPAYRQAEKEDRERSSNDTKPPTFEVLRTPLRSTVRRRLPPPAVEDGAAAAGSETAGSCASAREEEGGAFREEEGGGGRRSQDA